MTFRAEFINQEFERLTKGNHLSETEAYGVLSAAFGAESLANWFIWLGQSNQEKADSGLPEQESPDTSLNALEG